MTAPKKAPGRLKIAVDDTVKKLNQEVAARGVRATNAPVSYTHLTLPTTSRV